MLREMYIKRARFFLISFYFLLNSTFFFLFIKMPKFIGSIDQGTTSTRFVIFDEQGSLITFHQIELEQHYPQPGYVI